MDIEETIFWQPRVMRHLNLDDRSEFSVHEVYFDDGRVTGWTEDALSPRCATVEELKGVLEGLAQNTCDTVVCGDLQYEYDKATVSYWLECLVLPTLDYRSVNNDSKFE